MEGTNKVKRSMLTKFQTRKAKHSGKTLVSALSVAILALIVIPLSVSPSVSLLTAESFEATNTMVGEYTPPAPRPWEEESETVENAARWLNDISLNSSQNIGNIEYFGQGANSYQRGGNYGVHVGNGLTFAEVKTEYMNICITLASSSDERIFFYLVPAPDDSILIREWGSGNVVGKIVSNTSGNIDIIFRKAWIGTNLPAAKDDPPTYSFAVTGISNSRSISFTFGVMTNNAGYPNITQFGGDDRVNGSYDTVHNSSVTDPPWWWPGWT
jgi:hypothetical protein